jgi:hypothetical protein
METESILQFLHLTSDRLNDQLAAPFLSTSQQIYVKPTVFRVKPHKLKAQKL